MLQLLQSRRRLASALVLVALLVPGEVQGEAGRTEAPPWRVVAAVQSPTWLYFSATHRTRVERLWNQFRAGAPGHDAALALRTTLRVELRLAPIFVGGELIDSRLYLADDNAPLNTSLINPLEPLQAYAGVELRDLLSPGAVGGLRLGRFTRNLGSRRLVARNRFRNTTNAFTGLELWWRGASADRLRGLLALPIQRRPTAVEDLRQNAIALDRESTAAVFWGIFAASRPLWREISAELYLFGLHERDTDDVATRNRRLLTPGLRLLRQPAPGRLDLQLEAVVQAGTSRASSKADDVTDLDHLALFAHFSVGYTIGGPWRPRLALHYDYASGDADPDDGDNGRFDTLFGARRFELGPSGIYGAFARSNLNSPGVRVQLCPHRTLVVMADYRAAWLAQARDAWTTSGVRDPTGGAGSFVGQQVEVRLRFRPLPGNVLLEVGFAHTWLGGVATGAPNVNAGAPDPSYLYSQVVLEV